MNVDRTATGRAERERQGPTFFLDGFFRFPNLVACALRRWKLVAAFAVAGALAGYLATVFLVRPVYTSHVTVWLWRSKEAKGAAKLRNNYLNLYFGSLLANDYQMLLRSVRVRDRVKQALRQRYGDEKIWCRIRGSRRTPQAKGGASGTTSTGGKRSTRIITIYATARKPEIAQFVAQVTAESFTQTVREVLRLDNVQLIDAADLPTEPVGKRPLRKALMGGAGGLAAGWVLAILLCLLDWTVRDPEQIASILHRNVLGSIPLAKGGKKEEPLAARLDDPEGGTWAESFRIVRTTLPYLCPDGGREPGSPGRVFLFTSTARGEGKSECAAALARLTARAGKSVLLIDANLRNPTLRRCFGAPASASGLAALLAGRGTWEETLLCGMEGGKLDLLPGTEPPPPNPAELLMSRRLPELIRRARTGYEFVFIDSACARGLPDPLTLAAYADAVVFVVACGQEKIGAIRETLEAFDRIPGKRGIGVLVNRVAPEQLRRPYDASSYDRYETEPPSATNRRNER